ncbi:MAG: alpha-amylase family glycosyl hydrolase, partial [Bdellovibrionales bacterium]
KMDPYFGKPEDLNHIDAKLMFDFVLNHLSVHGEWFQKFLEDEEGYEDFFVTIPEDKIQSLDWEKIFRPREHNPVIPYTNSKGEVKHVWCTFSETQADINIANPDVFCAVMQTLVKDFIAQGASWIRLDAIGYLVKMFGLYPNSVSTSCFGIEETHNILKVMRAFLNDIAPSVTLVPEVNATKDVIKTYYGENQDEGHLVYEFPSAPLSLFAIYQQNSSAVVEWAKGRNKDTESIGLAFTGSHDGIGVLPMADVPDLKNGTPALTELLHQIERRGGGINYKSKVVNGKAKRIPYEACITWLQAVLTPPEHAALKGNRLSQKELNLIMDRFLASQSFIYTAPHCVPADYMGLLTGLLNDDDLYYIAGHRRNKNRGLVQTELFEKALSNPETNYEVLRAKIFNSKKHLIETRKKYPAFSPYAKCDVDVIEQKHKKKPIYSILRHSPHCDERVLALTNCSESKVQGMFASAEIKEVEDLLSNNIDYELTSEGILVKLKPYQIAWLKLK